MKKVTEDVHVEKPLAGRMSDHRAKRKIRKMSTENEIKKKDAPQTPARVRKREMHDDNYSSPSLKHVHVTKLRELFELELTDRDTLPTTSPPSTRSEYKSKLKP